MEELRTLPDRAYANPALSNAKGDAQWTNGDVFFNVQLTFPYWSSTTRANNPNSARGVNFDDGDETAISKTIFVFVWCVRGGN
jgi:hypothetical protein